MALVELVGLVGLVGLVRFGVSRAACHASVRKV
jgi:hypothetical protein